jgi:DNA-directed RNA polymerase specialized sigma subunit
MMTTEELIALAQSGDTEASERLVLDNAGLIWSVAKR